jgi:phage terminase large subunit
LSTLKVKVPAKLAPLLQPKRYKGAWGGRGGAKSHFFAEQIICQALTGKRIVCLREVQNSIKESVKQLLTDKITSFGLDDQFTILEQEIRGPNNSQIIFKGLQSFNAANIKSLEGFDIAWVEEAQTLSQHSLNLLRPTIRKPGSELWFSWNPRYKTDAVDKFFRKAKRDDAICVMINWYDNPWFKDTPLYADMLKDFETDPDTAEHVWNGAYGSSQGAILAKWVGQAERDGRINDDVIYDHNGAKIVVSCDLGFRDTTAWWYWQAVPGGFNLVDYQQGNGMDADDWIPEVRDKLIEIGGNVKCLDKIWMPHDAKAKTFQSKRTSMERFLTAFGVDKIDIVPQSRKKDQIEAARTLIKRCAFNKTKCEEGTDGLIAWEFVYNEESGIFSREPDHNWASHPSDAFAYGCQVMQENKPKDEEKEDKFPISGQKGKITTVPLDDLWKDTPRRNDRI